MRNFTPSTRSFVASFVAAGTLAISSTGFAQTPGKVDLPPEVADAKAADISDWALSGVVWSDANLARKLALVALRTTDNEATKKDLDKVIVQTSEVISALEKFGWRQVKQKGSEVAEESSNRRDDKNEDTVKKEIAVPTPEEADQAIAKFSGKPAGEAAAPHTEPVAASPPVMAPVAGVIDPVVPEERALEGATVETGSREALKKPASDRISVRDGWTLSATLPYSTESIYDQDDYDPDVDYFVENSRAVAPRAAAPVTRPRITPSASPDRQARTDQPPRRTQRPPAAERSRAVRTVPMRDYTTQDEPKPADASWVQFRLDANQWRYSMTNPSSALEATRDALRQLQSSAMIAGRSTENAELQEILKPILSMGR